MKNNLYFAESATADNYIILETGKGAYVSNCAPDGNFLGVSLHLDEGTSSEGKAAELRAAIIANGGQAVIDDMASDMDNGGWMDEAVDADGNQITMADLAREMDDTDSWKRDTIINVSIG